MEKLIIQRFVKTWIEDTYEVEKIDEDIIDKAIDYEIDNVSSEVLWNTVEELDDEVYDEHYNLLRKE